MPPTIYLFDIDGTLLSAGGAGRRAIERAFTQHCGSSGGVFDNIGFNGMTDPLIVRTGLGVIGRAVEPALVDAILRTYLEALAEEMPRSALYKVHPGIPQALDALAGRPGVAVGLGTGNLEEGARLKLAHGRLDHHFSFGGFGSDHEERSELLRVGVARGAARLGADLTACRVVVVGDTERDIVAARAIGATCICVGTGGVALDVLRAAGAARAFPDLTAAGALDALLDP